MRKFSKILTVLLTLALLCGTILSVVAQAEETESRESLNITGVSHNKYTDFESTMSNGTHYVTLVGQNDTNVKKEYVTVDGNTYGRYSSKGHNNVTGSAEVYLTLSDYSLANQRAGIANIGAHDYTVIDFEIGTDKYVFSFKVPVSIKTTVSVSDKSVADSVTETTATEVLYKTVATVEEYEAFVADPSLLQQYVKETLTSTTTTKDKPSAGVNTITTVEKTYGAVASVNNDLGLAFIHGMAVNVHGRAADVLSNPGNTTNRKEIYSGFMFYTVKDSNGVWYLSVNDKYSSDDIKLTNEIGKFDHVTYVLKASRTADSAKSTGYSISGSKAYMFVNGEFVKEASMGIGSYESCSPAWLRLSVGNAGQNNDKFSVCIDNVAINWYGYRAMNTEVVDSKTYYKYSTVDTVYKSEGYGIDDYINNKDYNRYGLWVCEDIVYGTDYVNPNGVKNINAQISALNPGDTLAIDKTYTNVSIPVDIINFTVVANNGAKFTLDAASAANYTVSESVNGDVTTYILNAKTSQFVNNTYSVTSAAGNDSNNYNSGAGTWTAYRSTGTDETVVAGANGNKYLRVTISAPGVAKDECFVSGTSRINNAQFGPSSNDCYADYKYTTIDVDIGVDSYVYSWQEEINGQIATKYSTSTDDIPAGVEYTKGDLAYTSGFYYYLRSNAAGANPSNSGLLNVTFSKNDDDGLFYVTSANAGGKKIALANEIGVFDHFTFVLRSAYDADGKFIGVDAYCYVNGQLLYHVYNTTVATATTSQTNNNGTPDDKTDDFTENVVVGVKYLQKLTMSYDWSSVHSAINTCYPVAEGATDIYANLREHFHEFADKYSQTFDNYAVNLYSANDYNTQFLDKFFDDEEFSTSAKLYDCKGVVYSRNYVSPNGWLSTDGGANSTYLNTVVAEKLAALETGAAIVTNRDLLSFTPATGVESFTLTAVDNAKFELSDEAYDNLYSGVNADGVITVTKYDTEDAVKFEFVDINGDTFLTKYVAPNGKLKVTSATNILTNCFDKKTGSLISPTGWTIDLGNGKINAVDYIVPTEGMPATAIVTPTVETLATLKIYAIYTVDEYGIPRLFDQVSLYDTMDTFKAQIQAAPSGATAILLYDTNTKYDIGVQTNGGAIAIGAGKTFSLDLNGRTLVDGYSNKNVGAWGDTTGCAFILGKGATFNFYSSKSGAQWYQLKYNISSGDRRVYSKGIVTSQVAEATVNFGDVYDANGNLIIDSADFDVFGSLIIANPASGSTKDSCNYTVNVNGGNYYAFGIGRYAMIVSYIPKITINIKNACFINNGAYATYGIFSNQTKNTDMYVNAYNSTFVSPNAKENMVFNNASDIYSEHYYEDCTIIAAGFGASKVTLGEGNYVSCAGAVTYADGVAATATDVKFTALLHHPVLVNKSPAVVVYKTNENGDYVLDKDGNKIADHHAPADDIAASSFKAEEINGTVYFTIADSVYATQNWNNTTKTFTGYVTYKGDAVPAGEILNPTYYAPDGSVFDASAEKWHKDSMVFNPTHPTTYDLGGMYIANNITWTDNGGCKYTLADYAVAGNFKGMLSNATLSSGLTYNIYVPAEAGVTLTGVNVGTISDKLFEYEGKKYYVISVDVEAKSFDASNISVTFSAPSILGGDAKVGTQTLVADVVGYATKVVNTYKCGSAEATLIYEMMNYKEEVAKLIDLMNGKTYARNDATTAFFAIFAGHADCTCGVEIKFSASEKAEISALAAKGIKGAGFDMVEVGVISMVLASDDPDLAVSVSYFDGLNTKTVIATYNEGYYVTEGIPAAYIDNVMTITVDGATGTYCLAAYINSDGVPAEAKVVAEALYKYAMAAEAYKHVVKAQ